MKKKKMMLGSNLLHSDLIVQCFFHIFSFKYHLLTSNKDLIFFLHQPTPTHFPYLGLSTVIAHLYYVFSFYIFMAVDITYSQVMQCMIIKFISSNLKNFFVVVIAVCFI